MTTVRTRVLIADDTPAIHEDYVKILCPAAVDTGLADLQAAIFGPESRPAVATTAFELTSALQGQAAETCVLQSLAEHRPFAVAFIDMRMPPGWDGLETIEHLWRADPRIQVVICSAYSDHDWRDIIERLGVSDRLLILKKPFDPSEVLQCATALAHKWDSERIVEAHIDSLEKEVQAGAVSLTEARERIGEERRRREALQAELQLAQKLESIGRLAAGIAHEINTPVQYIGDSINFLHSAVGEMQALLGAYRAAIQEMQPPASASLVESLAERESAADLEFLSEEVPKSFTRTREGVDRVADIVRAMKEFAHPPASVHAAADLNHAIETTLLIARNEYKYAAMPLTTFDALPEICCNIGEINQVVLNLIVNASHAIADAGRDATTGTITISTRLDGEFAEIVVADNGCGIAPDHRSKIFDPFFTTKDVGRGTGQGLALVRSIVVDRHGGRLAVDSEVGVGTAFHVWLPVQSSAETVS